MSFLLDTHALSWWLFNDPKLSAIAHAQQAGLWSHAHRDPFDRMLAAQAKLDDLTLISLDPELRQFGVGIVW